MKEVANDGMNELQEVTTAILDDVVTTDDGITYIQNFATWFQKLSSLEPNEHARTFIELAHVARLQMEYGHTDVARRLAILARIGLQPIARQD